MHLNASAILQRCLPTSMPISQCLQSAGSMQRHWPVRGPHHCSDQLCGCIAPDKGVLHEKETTASSAERHSMASG